MFKTTTAKMTGTRPEVLVDKLGERLAFKRTSTRLYEAMLMKTSGLPGEQRATCATTSGPTCTWCARPWKKWGRTLRR